MPGGMQQWTGAEKRQSTLLVLFIPSVDRDEQETDQEMWTEAALTFLGSHFGGGTAFPQGRGVWRDDRRGGRLVFDEPVVMNCYTSDELLEECAPALAEFLREMGRATFQGAVGFVIDRDYFELTI